MNHLECIKKCELFKEALLQGNYIHYTYPNGVTGISCYFRIKDDKYEFSTDLQEWKRDWSRCDLGESFHNRAEHLCWLDNGRWAEIYYLTPAYPASSIKLCLTIREIS